VLMQSFRRLASSEVSNLPTQTTSRSRNSPSGSDAQRGPFSGYFRSAMGLRSFGFPKDA
jgi:hypothetical protein